MQPQDISMKHRDPVSEWKRDFGSGQGVESSSLSPARGTPRLLSLSWRLRLLAARGVAAAASGVVAADARRER